jgi:hypothetical protein
MADDVLGERKIFASGFDFTARPMNTGEGYHLNRALPGLAAAVAQPVICMTGGRSSGSSMAS